LKRGELIDQGSHDELLERCETYRRIFAHYEIALPSGSLGNRKQGSLREK